MNYQVGDYITTQLNKGYFRVENSVVVKCINQETNQAEEMTWLLLKKALNDKFECKNLLAESIHTYWCKKVDDDTKERIETFFSENPKGKRKFDEFTASTKGILHKAVTCNEEEEIELHETMQRIKNLGLTEKEIDNLSVMKKYEFSGLYGAEVRDKKIILLDL